MTFQYFTIWYASSLEGITENSLRPISGLSSIDDIDASPQDRLKARVAINISDSNTTRIYDALAGGKT